ncbi:MAG: LD-carboxypeptidase [Pseudomonadota bacterium]
MTRPLRIGIMAPGRRLDEAVANDVRAIAERNYAGRLELVFHPQCALSDGHFAGDDAARRAAFFDLADDPALDAVWFARGGYGSARLIDDRFDRLSEAARAKRYLGYSDAGFLLARLYRAGCAVAHGPMPCDLVRGAAPVRRALDYLADPQSGGAGPSVPVLTFNLTVLVHLLCADEAPPFDGVALALEDVDEHLYAVDRNFRSVTTSPKLAGCLGVFVGRFGAPPDNDVPFGRTAAEIARFWCEKAGLAVLGDADVGHDADNTVVAFGRPRA